MENHSVAQSLSGTIKVFANLSAFLRPGVALDLPDSQPANWFGSVTDDDLRNAVDINVATQKGCDPFTSTTECIAVQVRSTVQANNNARVLVLGRGAQERAKSVSQMSHFPKQLQRLESNKEICDDTVYFSESCGTDQLEQIQGSSFDAIMCFNISHVASLGSDTSTSGNLVALMHQLRRISKPGAALSGTALLPVENDWNENECSSDCYCSLKCFRNSVEARHFYMHTALDMSLEGTVELDFDKKALRKLRATMNEDEEKELTQRFLGQVQEGHVMCTRFLATKKAQTFSRSSSFTLLSEKTIMAAEADEEKRPVFSDKFNQSLSSSPSSSSSPASDYRTFDFERASSPSSSASPRCSASLHRHEIVRTPPAISYKVDTGVVVSGVSVGLPNAPYPDRPMFDKKNFEYIFRGDNYIAKLTQETKEELLDMNIVTITKKDGKRIEHTLTKDNEMIQLAGRVGHFDLQKEYGVPNFVVQCLDTTYQMAIAAGIEALRDAGIELGTPATETSKACKFGLPEEMRDETGVIFASSFPCLDSAVDEVTRFAMDKERRSADCDAKREYAYNRKLLFKFLVQANNQLAELIKARGPNTQMNSACSSTTHAISIAEDWIRLGRCKRVVVISADNASNENLLKFLGTGFLSLGAASKEAQIKMAASPFDCKRSGMILGAGACGMVIEAATSCLGRGGLPKSELMGSRVANSAFHAALLDRKHISSQFKLFIDEIKDKYTLDADELAQDCIYFSHETFTTANGGCAKAELDALAAAFGEKNKEKIMLCNTKGLTAHPMGVGIEDVVAVASLAQGLAPAVPNHTKTDPILGQVNLCQGGEHTKKYAMRFAAGFGSQVALLLFKKWDQHEWRARIEEEAMLRNPAT